MTPRAALPMYDWLPNRAATDALWQFLKQRLWTEGFAAPDQLDRTGLPLSEIWTSPDLLVAQTCGLPYVRDLREHVHLIATPAYNLADCRPGRYRSRIVVHAGSSWACVADLAGMRAAINGRESQSGFVALAAMTPGWAPDSHFSEISVTGSHLASMQAVADGQADIAAIDAVSFLLAEQHFPEITTNLRVLDSSPETPGLPLITAIGRSNQQIMKIRQAVLDVFSAPETETVRRDLHISGAVVLTDRDYDPIREMARQTRRANMDCD